MFEEVASRVVRAIGIEGVSTVALVLLVSVALYAHKAASAGQRVASAGSTVQHDLKVVALVLAALLVLGVATLDVERGRELLRVGIEHVRRAGLVERVVGWVS